MTDGCDWAGCGKFEAGIAIPFNGSSVRGVAG